MACIVVSRIDEQIISFLYAHSSGLLSVSFVFVYISVSGPSPGIDMLLNFRQNPPIWK
jgi:hypothetical protein